MGEMQTKMLWGASLASNLVLAVVLLLQHQPASPRGETRDSRPDATPDKVAPIGRTNVVVPTPATSATFDWRSVESPDYRQYIANLRAIGCPEETVKDIVIADVMKFYAQRWWVTRTRRPFKFWETDEKRNLPKEQRDELKQAAENYEKELPRILHELLGINFERELTRYMPGLGLFGESRQVTDEEKLGLFSEDKRRKLLAWRDEYEWRRRHVEERAEQGEFKAADREEQLRQIEREQQAALAGILTSTEIEEYEMAISDAGDILRSKLAGFDPSPEEFRLLFRLQKAFDDKYANADTANPQVVEEKKADQARLEEAIRQQLDDSRFAEYQRSADRTYRELSFFCAELELPPTLAISAFEIKQVAEQKKRDLLDSAALRPEQRQAALGALEAETRLALCQTMGSNTFLRYDQLYGGWMQVLGTK